MVSSQSFSKKMCMTELHAELHRFDNKHYFDAGSGKINSSFGFITKGRVTLTSIGKKIKIGENGLFFVPEGIRYNSVWSGSPEIEFYSLHIISTKFDVGVNDGICTLQHIKELSNKQTADIFKQIYTLFASGNRIDKIKAVGIYYGFYAEVFPYMQIEPLIKYNSVLLSAINYIEENYKNDFDMEELAAHCCISVSRIYHYFNNELNTTPVKYRNGYRIERAASDLRSSELSIEEIAAMNGFNSASYFRKSFKNYTRITPSKYRAMVRE